MKALLIDMNHYREASVKEAQQSRLEQRREPRRAGCCIYCDTGENVCLRDAVQSNGGTFLTPAEAMEYLRKDWR